jgi:hypothetical protein
MYYTAKIRDNTIEEIYSAKSDKEAVAVGLSLMDSDGVEVSEIVQTEFDESGKYEHGEVTYCWGEAQSTRLND